MGQLIQILALEIDLNLSWVDRLVFSGFISNVILGKDRFENRFLKSQLHLKSVSSSAEHFFSSMS